MEERVRTRHHFPPDPLVQFFLHTSVLLQADWTYRWTRPTLTFGEFLLLYGLPVRPQRRTSSNPDLSCNTHCASGTQLTFGQNPSFDRSPKRHHAHSDFCPIFIEPKDRGLDVLGRLHREPTGGQGVKAGTERREW
jgi:hypothetical protein